MKADAVKGKYGSELVTIDCKDVKLQLQEDDLVIGTRTRKALKKLTSDQQKHFILGVRSFCGTAASKLQDKLPLKNSFLQQLKKILITEELKKQIKQIKLLPIIL